MPGPSQQTTHGKHSVVIQSVLQCSDICARHFCWNATSFQILSTCQGHLTHLSDFRRISRAPMVHQGMLIDWITVRPKTQFEEEVNKTTCPQQPVRLFDHFSPLAGDSAYLDLSETWVPQKSSWSLTKGPFWRTPNLETKPYLDLSIFATKSLQFWWSSQKSHPWQCWIRWMFGSQRAHEKMTGGSWLPCQHSTAAAHVAFQPPSFLDKSRRHFKYLSICKFCKHYTGGTMSPRDPLTVGKACHRTAGKEGHCWLQHFMLKCLQLKHRLQTQPLSHWPRFLPPECLHLQTASE